MDIKTNLFLYFLAGLTGGVGGCGAVMLHVTRGSHVPAIILLAYVVVGTTVGIITGAWLLAMSNFTDLGLAIHELIAWSGSSGLVTTMVLVFLQKASKLVLKWRGIEVQFTLREQNEERRVPAEAGES